MVLRLPNPLRGRPCLNTRLSPHRDHHTVTHLHTSIYTQDPLGMLGGDSPVRPSGLTDTLALFRYLKVVLISWEVCCQNIVLVLILHYGYCIVHNYFISQKASDFLFWAFWYQNFFHLTREKSNIASVNWRQELCEIYPISSELAHFRQPTHVNMPALFVSLVWCWSKSHLKREW